MSFILKCLVVISTVLVSATAYAEIAVKSAWVRATAGTNTVTAGYALIVNSGTQPDRLIDVSSPEAGRIELHRSSSSGGMMSMSPVEDMTIPPNSRIELKPGDYHLMILQIRKPLKKSESFPLQFRFERKGLVEASATVAPLTASNAPAQ